MWFHDPVVSLIEVSKGKGGGFPDAPISVKSLARREPALGAI